MKDSKIEAWDLLIETLRIGFEANIQAKMGGSQKRDNKYKIKSNCLRKAIRIIKENKLNVMHGVGYSKEIWVDYFDGEELEVENPIYYFQIGEGQMSFHCQYDEKFPRNSVKKFPGVWNGIRNNVFPF